MTQAEMVKEIAESLSMSQENVRNVLDLWSDTCTAELMSGKKVTIPRIGILTPCDRAERKGRNPKTGEAIDIPARTVITFNMSKYAKDALNS